jgi:hypothetical protein
MKGAGDFELWSRFVAGAELYSIDEPIGVFRTHDGQESVAHAARMREEAQTALRRAGGSCMPLWRAKWSRRFARLASGNPVLERFGFDWKAWWLTKDAQTSSFRRERRSIIPVIPRETIRGTSPSGKHSAAFPELR